MQQVEVAVIGTGWCGGIRAETLSRSSIVDKLHICDIRPERLAEVERLTNAASATSDAGTALVTTARTRRAYRGMS